MDNRVLQQRIKDAGGHAIASLFDRSAVANIGEVFATEVKVIREELDGDEAQVTIQVGEQLPLATVHLTRLNGVWIIQPDPPIAGVVEELANLGEALRRVAQTVEQRPMTVEQIKKEMDFWTTPVLRRIKKLIVQGRD